LDPVLNEAMKWFLAAGVSNRSAGRTVAFFEFRRPGAIGLPKILLHLRRCFQYSFWRASELLMML
jgi:hypothetical protein